MGNAVSITTDSNGDTCMILPAGTWTRGTTYVGDVRYETVNPIKSVKKAQRPAPKPEAPIGYGPFTILPVYRTPDGTRWTDIPPPVKLGYIVRHVDSGCEWWTVVYKTIPAARGYARRIADAFEGIVPVMFHAEVAA